MSMRLPNGAGLFDIIGRPDFELAGLPFQNKRLGAIASANDIGSPNLLALALNEDREIAER